MTRLASSRPSLAALAGFLACVVAANWLTTRFGVIPVGPGLVATAGTLAAGVALTFRDSVQDRLGRGAVIVTILAGSAMSAALSPGLAVASGLAFLVSEAADFAIYTPLQRRSRDAAVWASAAAGSVVDSCLFLALAFGIEAVTVPGTAGQVAGKLEATLLAWAALRRWR